MGELLLIVCKKCNASREHMVGCGEVFWKLETILSSLPTHHRAAAKHALANNPGAGIGGSYMLHHCPGCHRLKALMRATVRHAGNSLYTTDHFCIRCDTLMIPIEPEQISQLPCERCHAALESDPKVIGLWD